MTTCIRCGCTDTNACMTDGAPCHWALISTKTMAHKGKRYAPEDLGICSSCDDNSEPDGFARVDGDLDPADPDVFDDLDDEPRIIQPGDPEFYIP